jgi:hypothetical protein
MALKRVPARLRTPASEPQNYPLSTGPGCAQNAELPRTPIPISHTNFYRLSFSDSSPRSPMPNLAHSSIAAPTTASAFLQASLSKMPRSNPRHPQHPAPRHFRSRLTTLSPMERLLRAKLLTLPRSTSSPASWLVCRDLLILGFDFTYHRSPEALSEEDRRNLSG